MTGLTEVVILTQSSDKKNPKPEPSWTSTLVTPPSFGNEKQDLESTETMASMNQKANEKALSWKRKIYLFTTALACVVLVVIGIILGMRAYRQREEEADKALVDPKLLADHTQAQLGGAGIEDHSKDEIHEIDDYESDDVDEVEVELDGDLGEEEEENEEEVESEIGNESATPSIAFTDASAQAKLALPVTSSASDPLATATSPSKHLVVTASDPAYVHESFPDLQALFDGNEEFRNETNLESPGMFKALGLGQTPGFAFLGCSDSRVSETLILGAKVGELFVVSRSVLISLNSIDADLEETLIESQHRKPIPCRLALHGIGLLLCNLSPRSQTSRRNGSHEMWSGSSIHSRRK